MTMDTQKKDQITDAPVEARDSHKSEWLDLGGKHPQNATRRHSSMPWSKLIATIQNKLSLSRPEKIALVSIAVIFLGLAVWAGVWLKQKNQLAIGNQGIEFPSKGAYATISNFSSYWKRCGDTLGIKIGAVAIPAATITLRKDSSSGALRFYFRDSNMKSVGDPVTMSFQNGTFSNGSHTIEITASDGFHNQVDFNTYQLGTTGAWELEVLEAKDEMEPRANFSLLFKTVISPALR
jgi:hypothetical protein